MKMGEYINNFVKVMRLMIVISFFGILLTNVVYSVAADGNCECPQIIDQSLEMYYDSPAIISDLIKGHTNKIVFTLTVKGNQSDLERYHINPLAGIYCDGEIKYNETLYCQDNNYSKFTNTIALNCNNSFNSFSVPEDATSCRAMVKVLVEDDKGSTCECNYNINSLYIEPLTFEEYINKYQVEISQQQTEIMKEQKDISQQQKQAMDTSNLMIVIAAVIGVVGVIIGTILGFIFSDFRYYQNKRKEDIQCIYAPLLGELKRIERGISNFKDAKNLLSAAGSRNADDQTPLSDRHSNSIKFKGDAPTEWDGILYRHLDIWIPDKLKEELEKFYNNEPLFKRYSNLRSESSEDKIKEKVRVQEEIRMQLDRLIEDVEKECKSPNIFDYIRRSGRL